MPNPRIISLNQILNTPIPYHRYLKFLHNSRMKQQESILLCEHTPTITAGIKSEPQNLLSTSEKLNAKGISVHKISRGGDHTAHEIGQLLIYPHLDLRKYNLSLSNYFNLLLDISKEAILSIWSLDLENKSDAPGLYTNQHKKILSIGIDYRKHITGHGIALNTNNDFSTFQHINPCGLSVSQMTNLNQEIPNFDLHQMQLFKNLWIDILFKQLTKLRIH